LCATALARGMGSGGNYSVVVHCRLGGHRSSPSQDAVS
jgi:hypothetical protein